MKNIWSKAKTLVLTLPFLLGLWGQAAFAETAREMPREAEAFIQVIADKTLTVLDDIRLNQEERDAQFHALLADGFEIDYMAKLVLGHNRRKATAEEMAGFQEVFPDYIISIYAKRLAKYGDERFYVTGSIPAGKKDIYVQSEVTRRGRDSFSALWRVRLINGELRIIDLKIAGISMLQTQRDDFSSRINAVGMVGLIEDMQQKTDPEGP